MLVRIKHIKPDWEHWKLLHNSVPAHSDKQNDFYIQKLVAVFSPLPTHPVPLLWFHQTSPPLKLKLKDNKFDMIIEIQRNVMAEFNIITED